MRVTFRSLRNVFWLSAVLFCTVVCAADEPGERTNRPTTAKRNKRPRKSFHAKIGAAAAVDVSHDADKHVWALKGKKNTVVLNEKDLSLKIQSGSTIWSMAPSASTDMLLKSGDDEFAVRLADAGRIDIVQYDAAFKTGVKITLDEWKGKQGRVKLPLYLTVALEGPDEELSFDIAADEREAKVRRLDWPTAMDGREVDYTVLSNGRGALLPRNWPKWYHPIRAKENETTEVQSNIIESWSMSWWGFEKGNSAMMIIVETPDDAAYQFEHPAGGPTVIGPRWRESLGNCVIRALAACAFSRKATMSIWQSAIGNTSKTPASSFRSKKRLPARRS